MRKGLSFAAVAGAVGLCSSIASADVQHTVAKGHTIQAIANRYRVSPKSIIEANKLKDPRHLKIGDVLTIPKVDPPKKDDKSKDGKAKAGKDAKDAKKDRHATTYTAKPKTPGVIHVRRVGSTEELDLRITDKSGKVSTATLDAMKKIMRSPTGASHQIEARLISLLGIVSNHFGSRKIEIVSGFRPYAPTQYTHHSNHNHGKAIDFRVVGVPNEVVRDFCRTLRNVGCGYYPNSTFVHMDVRGSSAFWIDYAKPGEPPRYNAPNVEADEGTSDVHPGTNANPAPPPSPTQEPDPSTTDGTSETPAEKPTLSAPGRADQETAPGRADQETAPGRADQETAPGRAHQETAPGRAHQETAPGRAHQESAPAPGTKPDGE